MGFRSTGFGAEGELPGLVLGPDDQVVDHAGHLVGLLVQFAEHHPGGSGELVGPVQLDELAEADHAGERGAQGVAHSGQELVLAPGLVGEAGVVGLSETAGRPDEHGCLDQAEQPEDAGSHRRDRSRPGPVRSWTQPVGERPGSQHNGGGHQSAATPYPEGTAPRQQHFRGQRQVQERQDENLDVDLQEGQGGPHHGGVHEERRQNVGVPLPNPDHGIR